MVIVEYATVEEVTTEGSTDPGPVDRLTGEVPVKSIPLTEEPETETVTDPILVLDDEVSSGSALVTGFMVYVG